MDCHRCRDVLTEIKRTPYCNPKLCLKLKKNTALTPIIINLRH
jgi:hypothetical protein